ncbi:uncharacterized protein LY89DRAFT_691060 [Mollisia scopiformis]|uniref:Uncharacterized protein n=1 Tax=Mollisia scopiformis TaxID=149040 RepID=A0A132B8A4_MOLSC|nr:uncharacterized protein LY89DRAFT_691060 [Mollisia scopiformis]KUJ08638.1 hypothetical protein LY89DRAFT_691060 [Mollisia scopiformis]
MFASGGLYVRSYPVSVLSVLSYSAVQVVDAAHSFQRGCCWSSKQIPLCLLRSSLDLGCPSVLLSSIVGLAWAFNASG